MPPVEYIEESDYPPQDCLERFVPQRVTPPPVFVAVEEPSTRERYQRSLTPGREQLFPGFREPDQDLELNPSFRAGSRPSMAEPADPDLTQQSEQANTMGQPHHISRAREATAQSRTDHDQHELALIPSNDSGAAEADRDDATRERVDSAHSTGKPPFSEPHGLALQTGGSFTDHPQPSEGGPVGGSIRDSPTLQKHVLLSGPQHISPLPPLHTTSPGHPHASASSPTTEQLPGFQRMQYLADLATQEVQHIRHQHSHSISSATSQSPIFQHPTPQLASAQTSPSAYYSALSPTSTTMSSAHTMYGSPTTQYAPQPYYPDRRISNPLERMPAPRVPSLPSASSGESHAGATSGGSEGYSTNQTTPSDAAGMAEGTPRVLPPSSGVPIVPPPINIPGIYRCDYPGCTAAPFQTQYLLSSHKNVHSQSRPHYCPEPGCPRGEGGQGFKRKNEMIRHGLVHKSPGYVCPFCPEREHRYPRPDNLQRHVRVHHVDKNKDDPELQRVLSQRIEGSTKSRRRRTHGAAASA